VKGSELAYKAADFIESHEWTTGVMGKDINGEPVPVHSSKIHSVCMSGACAASQEDPVYMFSVEYGRAFKQLCNENVLLALETYESQPPTDAGVICWYLPTVNDYMLNNKQEAIEWLRKIGDRLQLKGK